MKTLRLLVLNALVGLLTASTACSATAPANGTNDTDAANQADAQAPDSGAPKRSEACVQQDALVADVLDFRRKSPVLALAVTNEECKTSVVISADPGGAPAEDALFRVGSVTKTFVSATTLVLEREGKLSLGDLVSKYVEGFPALEKITVLQLLQHTSGLFNFTEDPSFSSLRKTKRTPREIVARALTTPPYFEPGQGFHYSNTNYTLLGMVIEKASGQKVSAAIRTRVLEPAKLTRTFFDGEEALPEPLVPGFDTKRRDVTFSEHPSEPWAAGAMVASIGDVSRWHQALFGGSFLDPISQAKLGANPARTDDTSMKYGLAVLMLDDKRTGGFGPGLAHGGDIGGFHTESIYYVAHKTTISAVVNQDGVDPGAVVLAVARALFVR